MFKIKKRKISKIIIDEVDNGFVVVTTTTSLAPTNDFVISEPQHRQTIEIANNLDEIIAMLKDVYGNSGDDFMDLSSSFEPKREM